MARTLRIEFPGAVYHITARGNERKKIFRNDRDKHDFLDILALVLDRFGWLCHSYSLMDNHYHLMIETPRGNLSRGMMQLNGNYAQHFNRKYNRVGHLFQDRYKAILVEKEAYLMELSRYVVLNPVDARIVQLPEEWPWSSYRATIGKTEKPVFLTIDWILLQFGRNLPRSRDAYKAYVLSGIRECFPKEALVGGLLLGSEKFLNDVNRQIGENSIAELKEFPRKQRLSSKPSLEEIFQKGMRTGKTRDEMIYMIYYDTDFTQREIAEYLGLHYGSVSRIIKSFEKKK